MREVEALDGFVAAAVVDPPVFALWPDYRALLLAADGLVQDPSDAESDTLLQIAEVGAKEALRHGPVEQLPTAALFIFDALDPMADDGLRAAAEDLLVHLIRPGPDVRIARRLITSSTIA